MSAALAICPRCEAQVEPSDLRCCVCALAVTAPVVVEHAAAQLVRCEACGAAVTYDPAVQAPRCAFCGAVTRVETVADPLEQAEAYLRFRVDAHQARAALKGFLAKKSWFRPSDLAQLAKLDAAQPLWWPGWVLDAEAELSWAADSDAGSLRAHWAPHAGSFRQYFRGLLLSASRGLTKAECTKLTPGYDLGDLSPKPEGPPAAQVERFDVTRSGARREVMAALEAEGRAEAQKEIPGSRVRNLHVAMVLRGLSTQRLGFPAWVLAYRYRKKLYRLVINGQEPGVRSGTAPYSPWRIGFAVLLGLGVIAAVVALIVRS
jgi:hypothetical protein